MPNIVKPTVLVNGSRTALIHFYLASDGIEGELVNYPLIDVDGPTSADTIFDRKAKLTITQVWHNFSWFDGLLSFDDLNPIPSWLLTRDTNCHIDFRHFGGLSDRYVPPTDENSTDRKNRILISTRGFAPLDSLGTLIIEVKKEVH